MFLVFSYPCMFLPLALDLHSPVKHSFLIPKCASSTYVYRPLPTASKWIHTFLFWVCHIRVSLLLLFFALSQWFFLFVHFIESRIYQKVTLNITTLTYLLTYNCTVRFRGKFNVDQTPGNASYNQGKPSSAVCSHNGKQWAERMCQRRTLSIF